MTSSANERANFCEMPFVSVYVTADGGVYPCCMALGGLSPCGSLASTDGSVVWEQGFAQMRKRMVARTPPQRCFRCSTLGQVLGRIDPAEAAAWVEAQE